MYVGRRIVREGKIKCLVSIDFLLWLGCRKIIQIYGLKILYQKLLTRKLKKPYNFEDYKKPNFQVDVLDKIIDESLIQLWGLVVLA